MKLTSIVLVAGFACTPPVSMTPQEIESTFCGVPVSLHEDVHTGVMIRGRDTTALPPLYHRSITFWTERGNYHKPYVRMYGNGESRWVHINEGEAVDVRSGDPLDRYFHEEYAEKAIKRIHTGKNNCQ